MAVKRFDLHKKIHGRNCSYKSLGSQSFALEKFWASRVLVMTSLGTRYRVYGTPDGGMEGWRDGGMEGWMNGSAAAAAAAASLPPSLLPSFPSPPLLPPPLNTNYTKNSTGGNYNSGGKNSNYTKKSMGGYYKSEFIKSLKIN